MTAARFLPLIPISIVLAGCGARLDSSGSTSPSSALHAGEAVQHAQFSIAPPVKTVTPSPAPSAPASPTPTPQPASAAAVLVVEQPASNGAYSVSLVSPDGHALSIARIPGAAQWTVVAGPGGAYWMDAGRVKMLTQHGAVRDLGGVPAGAGELMVSPDGSAYAYDTSTALKTPRSASENRIIVQTIGGASRIIADRISDPNRPVADAPTTWMYGLMSWTAQGILFRRELTGTCGCQAFDMQMLAGYTGIIDPTSEAVTDLTSDATCPLTALGSRMTAGCFHTTSTGAADELRVLNAGHVGSRFALSGKSVGGDGVFSADGATLAYETVPAASAGCGSSTFPTTLHILDIGTGSARAAQLTGLHAKLWPAGAPIYGDIDSGSASVVVTVDATTLTVHRVLAGPVGTRFVGVI